MTASSSLVGSTSSASAVGAYEPLGGAIPSALLILGVHAWPTVESLRRRQAFRQLCPSSTSVAVRFIMSQASSKGYGRKRVPFERPGEDGDIIFYRLSDDRSPKAVQKYLISNAFLRHASRLAFDFIGRSEDDALVNISALGAHLQMLTSVPMLVYTAKGSWVMWDREDLLPKCWNAVSAAWAGKGDCSGAHAGPFLLFQGPLVVYSRGLTRALVSLPRYDDDEMRVAKNWSGVRRQRLEEEKRDHPESPPRLGLVYSGMAEDVYYSGLIADEPAVATRNLTVVSVPLSEYDWRLTRPTHALRRAAVYHRLTTWTHLNASGLVKLAPARSGVQQPPPPPLSRTRRTDSLPNIQVMASPLLGAWWSKSRPPLARCQRFGDKFRVFRPPLRDKKKWPMEAKFCCRHWTICEP